MTIDVDYADFDPEVVALCKAINALPGLRTTESCCGHGKQPFRIWFRVDEGDHRGLFVLVRSFDRRYWKHGHQWSISISVGDEPVKPLPIMYLLVSETVGEVAYGQVADLIANINFHLVHENFLRGYGLPSDAFARWVARN